MEERSGGEGGGGREIEEGLEGGRKQRLERETQGDVITFPEFLLRSDLVVVCARVSRCVCVGVSTGREREWGVKGV